MIAMSVLSIDKIENTLPHVNHIKYLRLSSGNRLKHRRNSQGDLDVSELCYHKLLLLENSKFTMTFEASYQLNLTRSYIELLNTRTHFDWVDTSN